MDYSRLLFNMRHTDRVNSVVPPCTFPGNHYQIYTLFHGPNLINVFFILHFNDMNCTSATPNVDDHGDSILRRIHSIVV